MKKFKAYLIFILTGWRSVEVFGNPKEITGSYIACLKSKDVMCFYYSNYGNGNGRWWSFSVGDVSIENKVIYWKSLPKPPYTHYK